MFLWFPVLDLARAPRRAPLTARKKGSGYENGIDQSGSFFNPVWPEPLNDGSGLTLPQSLTLLLTQRTMGMPRDSARWVIQRARY